MLVEVRPSNEALLRARVPGAQDQCGRSSLSIFYRPRVARARRAPGRSLPPVPGRCMLTYKLEALGKTILLLEDWAEK